MYTVSTDYANKEGGEQAEEEASVLESGGHCQDSRSQAPLQKMDQCLCVSTISIHLHVEM